MEPDRFDNAVRAIFGASSRRALTRALVAVTAGTGLASLLSLETVAAKKGKKTHKHKEKKKNKRKKKVSDRCPKNSTFCQNPNESVAGQLSGCCNTQTNSEGDPFEVCTDCGCCPYNNSTCCRGGLYGLCCLSGSQCSFSANLQEVGCCSPADTVCHGGCCDPGEDCCLTPAPGNISYCCGVGLKCLIQGPNDITCQRA